MARVPKNKKDVFTIKTFQLCGAHSLIVGMDGSGVLKVRYTEENIIITIWDEQCENILHELTCSHNELKKEYADD